MVVLDESQSESSQEFKAASPEKMGKAEGGLSSSTDHGGDETTRRPSLAYFRRKEIKVRRTPVGEGYHGIVYEITGFRLREDLNYSREEHEARQRCSEELQRPDGTARYVMKHLHPRLLQAGRTSIENAALDLIAEATFLQQLCHPNVLPLRGLAHGGASAFRGAKFDNFFLVLDRLQGTLDQRIQQWRRSTSSDALLAKKLSYGLQIAQALSYLHEQQLVFRDLKPSNCGFSADDPDRIQIFDFGLCRKLPRNGHSEEVYTMSGGVGTRRYCAVEVCRHLPYNCKADVYSWSMVVLEVLTLDKPFADFSKEDHLKFVCEMGGTPNLSQYDLSPCIQTLLRHAWSRNVAKRWTVAQVCDEMELIMEDMQVAETSTLVDRPLDRRRSKAMDRKDVMVNLKEECSGTRGVLSVLA